MEMTVIKTGGPSRNIYPFSAFGEIRVLVDGNDIAAFYPERDWEYSDYVALQTPNGLILALGDAYIHRDMEQVIEALKVLPSPTDSIPPEVLSYTMMVGPPQY